MPSQDARWLPITVNNELPVMRRSWLDNAMGDQRRNEQRNDRQGQFSLANARMFNDSESVEQPAIGNTSGLRGESWWRAGMGRVAPWVVPPESRDWEVDGTPQIARLLGRCAHDESTVATMLHVKSPLCFSSPAAPQALDLACTECCVG
jgi:hypothetical protein